MFSNFNFTAGSSNGSFMIFFAIADGKSSDPRAAFRVDTQKLSLDEIIAFLQAIGREGSSRSSINIPQIVLQSNNNSELNAAARIWRTEFDFKTIRPRQQSIPAPPISAAVFGNSDLLSLILSHLDVRVLLPLRRVCVRWKDVIKKVPSHHTARAGESYTALSTLFPNLEKLTVDGISPQFQVNPLYGSFHNLTSLEMSSNNIVIAHIAHMTALRALRGLVLNGVELTRLTSLTSLSVYFANTANFHFVTALTDLSHLESLRIEPEHLSLPPTFSYSLLSDTIQRLTRLRHIDLGGYAEALVSSAFPSLTSARILHKNLSLPCLSLRSLTLQTHARTLNDLRSESLPLLEKLTIFFNYVASEDDLRLRLSTLRYLDLLCNQLAKIRVKTDPMPFLKLLRLRNVDLSNAQATEDDASPPEISSSLQRIELNWWSAGTALLLKSTTSLTSLLIVLAPSKAILDVVGTLTQLSHLSLPSPMAQVPIFGDTPPPAPASFGQPLNTHPAGLNMLPPTAFPGHVLLTSTGTVINFPTMMKPAATVPFMYTMPSSTAVPTGGPSAPSHPQQPTAAPSSWAMPPITALSSQLQLPRSAAPFTTNNNFFRDDGHWLSHLTNLRTLTLNDTNLSTAVWLSSLCRLEELTLAQHVLSPEGVRHLTALRSLRRLTVMDFERRRELRSAASTHLPEVEIVSNIAKQNSRS